MAQIHDMYVKIITSPFEPMGLPVDTVWRVNGVLGRYVVDNGYASVCDSVGTLIEEPWQPWIQSASVNAAALTLTYDMGMNVTDGTGFTVTVAGSDRTVNLAAPSGDTVVLTLASAVTAGQVVIVDYDESTGNMESDLPVDAKSLSNYTVTNVTP